jgi:hypothetical protein
VNLVLGILSVLSGLTLAAAVPILAIALGKKNKRTTTVALWWAGSACAVFILSLFVLTVRGLTYFAIHGTGPNVISGAEVFTPPPHDAYAECLGNDMSKQHCAKVAAVQHYKLTHEDRMLSETTPVPTEKPPTPEPTQDRHTERVQYQQFWNATVGNLAMVFVCVNYAAKAAGGGDSVTASRALQIGQKFADNAKDETLNGVPGEWKDNDEIGPRLFSAANSLSDAMNKMRNYLDESKPSEAVDAEDEATSASSDVEAATAAARSSYESMGGKASDIETMQSKVQTTITALDTLMGGSSSGDSQ